MSITEAKPKRENRTITLYLGNTLAEYEATYLTEAGIQSVIGTVEIADRLNWGCLATGHKPGCPRQLRFTHHDSYGRWAKHFDGTRSLVTILRVRCLDCGAVSSVQPAFIIRYKRYETDAVEKLLKGLRWPSATSTRCSNWVSIWPPINVSVRGPVNLFLKPRKPPSKLPFGMS